MAVSSCFEFGSSLLCKSKLIKTSKTLLLFALVFSSIYGATAWSWSQPLGGPSCSGLSILSWNIQILGQKKIADAKVIDIVTKVMKEHDIILVQEIRDAAETVPGLLLDALNAAVGSDAYRFVASRRAGSSISKEQYAIFYRKDKGMILDHHLYNDVHHKFERPPIVARFKAYPSASKTLNNFVMLGIHTKPTSAVEEVDALVDVYDDESKQYDQNNAIIMGDFNADCTYVCKDCWDKIRLRTEERFHWPIDDTADTTTSPTDCAYDRFVYVGNEAVRTFDGAEIIDFPTIYGLSEEMARDVSDHYPVRILIRC